MSNIKSKTSSRLLAAFMSLVMVFSMIPFSIVANAVTTEHPDAVTITVKDEDGNPVEGASVAFVIDSVINGDAYKEDTKTTDNNGVVEVMASDDFVADDFKIFASVSATGYTNGTLSTSAIATSTDNFDISVTSTTIKNVNIEAKNLTYKKGVPQELVSVTEIAGDTVKYQLDGGDETNEVPKKENVGTYNVKVTISREGKDDLVKEVTATINPADIEGISIEGINTKYNENKQNIVKLNGTFEADDTVTWTVNGSPIAGKDIPQETAIGSYQVTLTVNRGPNYKPLVLPAVASNILAGDLALGNISIKGLEGVYTVDSDGNPVAQLAVSVENKGDYNLKYQLDDGDLTVDDSAWVDEIPVVTDAGSYIVWVKAVKDNYNDADVSVTPAAGAVAPYNVYIAKAEQAFTFKNFTGTSKEEQLFGEVPYRQEYDFSAIDSANLAGGSITYKIEVDDDEMASMASIDANTGLLTVYYPGSIKVIATLSGNDNYKECVIEYTLNVSGATSSKGQFINFAESEKKFVIGTSSTVSEQKAEKKIV